MATPITNTQDERALATINVRLPKTLKAGGEAVLEKEGISVSEAIRRLYLVLEQEQKVPDCILTDGQLSSEGAIQKKRELLKSLIGIASAETSYEEARDERLAKHLRQGIH